MLNNRLVESRSRLVRGYFLISHCLDLDSSFDGFIKEELHISRPTFYAWLEDDLKCDVIFKALRIPFDRYYYSFLTQWTACGHCYSYTEEVNI